MPTLWFKVNQRALRDKLSNLLKDYISKRNKEERDTGSSPEHREFDNLLQDICEKLKQLMLEKAEKTEEEKDAAEKNWCTSMAKLSETPKREGAESSSKLSEKKMRSSGGDIIVYLKEKIENGLC